MVFMCRGSRYDYLQMLTNGTETQRFAGLSQCYCRKSMRLMAGPLAVSAFDIATVMSIVLGGMSFVMIESRLHFLLMAISPYVCV